MGVQKMRGREEKKNLEMTIWGVDKRKKKREGE